MPFETKISLPLICSSHTTPRLRSALHLYVGLISAILLSIFLTSSPSRCQSPAATNPAAGRSGEQGGASKSASGSATSISSTTPAPPPPGPVGRPRIGLALAGGGALAMSEIGVLQWFEEHHIPVDSIAGTSMGALVGALYATGNTPGQIEDTLNSDVFSSVFRIDTAYKNRGYRRREDDREMPNAVTIGLRHGISLRNSVLTDQGLNSFFDREFYRYDDRGEFNALPIPFRCIAIDLNDARIVTFARGSIPDAVRASVSLPGYFRPFEMNGHEGPLRLSASAIDEYRGTDHFLLSPLFLRRIANLPAPLGQRIYAGVGYEAGQMRAPDASTITRQDVFFGIFAETPLGVITLAPAFGDNGYRKFTFTLGKFF